MLDTIKKFRIELQFDGSSRGSTDRNRTGRRRLQQVRGIRSSVHRVLILDADAMSQDV